VATLSQRKKANARRNARRRGKKPGAYDNLRAAGKPMKRTKKGARSKGRQRARSRRKRT
jgi:hypothetical protein